MILTCDKCRVNVASKMALWRGKDDKDLCSDCYHAEIYHGYPRT